MAADAFAADRGGRPYLCSVVDSIRKKISQPPPQLPLAPSLGDGLDSSGAEASRRRKSTPALSSSACAIPARLAEFAMQWCSDTKIEKYQVLTREKEEQDAEGDSKAEAVAIYRVDSRSHGDNGAVTRSLESSIDGYEVNGEVSFRVGDDSDQAKKMSDVQQLRVVLGSGQAPDVLESVLRKAAPGWRAEVEEMNSSVLQASASVLVS